MKVIYRDRLGIVAQEVAPGTEIRFDGSRIMFEVEKPEVAADDIYSTESVCIAIRYFEGVTE